MSTTALCAWALLGPIFGCMSADAMVSSLGGGYSQNKLAWWVAATGCALFFPVVFPASAVMVLVKKMKGGGK